MTAAVAGMQAALLIRQKQTLRKKKGRRHELPSNVATKDIAPFPTYPPQAWGKFAAAAAAAAAGDRRGSLSDVAAVQHRAKASKAHRRWVKKNRIRDASCGDDDDGFGVEGSGANVVLYVGLGLVCVGLVISFVGLGEKGFKTAELRLIGPSLLAAGAFFCLLRVLFCTCPAVCCCCCPDEKRRRRKRKKRRKKLRGEQVSSSDDEIIVNNKQQPKGILLGGVGKTNTSGSIGVNTGGGGGGGVVLNVIQPSTSLIVNGDNNKHVVIPIKRHPPTPTPPSPPTMLRVHSVNVSPPTTVDTTLPNYICEDNNDLIMGKINPDPDAHILEPTTSSSNTVFRGAGGGDLQRHQQHTLQPPPSHLNPLTHNKTLNKLQRPREKELVLNASMLQNVSSSVN